MDACALSFQDGTTDGTLHGIFCSLSDEMRSRTQMQRLSGFFNNKVKQRTKTTPKGKNKQAGRQAEDWSTVKHEILTQH